MHIEYSAGGNNDIFVEAQKAFLLEQLMMSERKPLGRSKRGRDEGRRNREVWDEDSRAIRKKGRRREQPRERRFLTDGGY